MSYNVFRNGDVYVGQMKNGKICGLGYFLCEEPALRCEGEWADGTMNGFGRQVGPDDEKYTGEFVRGVKSGIGRFEQRAVSISGNFLDGDVYGFCIVHDAAKKTLTQGSFKGGKLHGFGCIKSRDQEYSYFGSFSAGAFHGRGEETIRGNVYSGEFLAGQRSGLGTYREPASNFVGFWLKGERSGFGVERFRNRDLYTGMFAADLKSGFGRYVHAADAATYTGSFFEGLRHGLGRLEAAAGGFYVGGWQLGKRDGLGLEVSADGRVYFGEWKKDRKEGAGFMSFRETQYQGQWVSGKPHGRGLFRGEDGAEKAGTFENGVLVRLKSEQDPRSYGFGLPQSQEEFLEQAGAQLGEVEAAINRKIREIDEQRVSFQEEIRLKRENLESLMKELQNRVDNVVLNCHSKLQLLEREAKAARLDSIVEEWNHKHPHMLGADARQSRLRLDLGRSPHRTPPKVASRPSLALHPALGSRPATPVRAAQRSSATKREMDDVNRRLVSIFAKEFADLDGPAESPAQDRRRQDAHQWDTRPLIHRQTSTGSLEERSEEKQRLQAKAAEMEEKERLIFLEKMSIKKQKDEILLLVEELHALKAQKTASKLNPVFQSEVFLPPDSQAATLKHPLPPQDGLLASQPAPAGPFGDGPPQGDYMIAPPDEGGMLPAEDAGGFSVPPVGEFKAAPDEVAQSALDREAAAGQEQERVWKSYCMKPQRRSVKLSLGSEESRFLFYHRIDEVVMSEGNHIYRVKLNEGKPHKVLSMIELEEAQQVVHLFNLKGRFGAVLLPDYSVRLFDLLDRVYSSYLPQTPAAAKSTLGRLGSPVHSRVFHLDFRADNEFVTFNPDSRLSIVSEHKLVPLHSFSLLEEADVHRFELMSVLVNHTDLEVFALYSAAAASSVESPQAPPYIIVYYNYETGFRFKHDLRSICPDSSLS